MCATIKLEVVDDYCLGGLVNQWLWITHLDVKAEAGCCQVLNDWDHSDGVGAGGIGRAGEAGKGWGVA